MFSLFKHKNKAPISSERIQQVPDEIQEWLSGIEVRHMPEQFLGASSGSIKHRSKLTYLWIGIGVIIAFLVGAAVFIFFSLSGGTPSGSSNQMEESAVPVADLDQVRNSGSAVVADGGVGDVTESGSDLSNNEGKNSSDVSDAKEDSGVKDGGVDVQKEEIRQLPIKEEPVEDIVPVISRGVDSDGDRLTDSEEILFSTSAQFPDSDLDGFDDGVEILRLYDPTQGRSALLKDSPLVREYVNTSFGYAVMFPSSWSITSFDANQRETVFLSGTGETFEVLVLVNSFGTEDARVWYSNQFQGSLPGDVSTIVINGLSGVMSSDGLNVYFVSGDNVFVLTYSLENASSFEYFTTFGMFMNSFRVFDSNL